jgi:hypothetical protein
MHYLKIFLTKPFYLGLLFLLVGAILIGFYKRGKLNKSSVINILMLSITLIIICFGYFYYDAIKHKQIDYKPATLVEGVIIK